MTQTTRMVGIALAVLGIVSYVGTGRTSVTALIPAFFGVALDFLHQSIRLLTEGSFAAQFLPQVFALLEDGGEMVMASIATAFVLTLPGIKSMPRRAEAVPG